MKSLDEIREYFSGDLFATKAAGAVIDEAEDGFARCSMELSDIHRNARGAVMGGAIFTLADFAFAVAANSSGMLTVSLHNDITFMHPAKGKTLYAKTRLVSSTRQMAFYEVQVTDELGTQVAAVSVAGYRKGPLPV